MMDKTEIDTQPLKNFGRVMGWAVFAIALLVLFRHKKDPSSLFIISAVLLVFSFVAPRLLQPLYSLWMRLAFLLAWVNTRLILVVLFYLIFTPIGIAMRLLRIDPLERGMQKEKTSYWRKKETAVFNPKDYQRQF